MADSKSEARNTQDEPGACCIARKQETAKMHAHTGTGTHTHRHMYTHTEIHNDEGMSKVPTRKALNGQRAKKKTKVLNYTPNNNKNVH